MAEASGVDCATRGAASSSVIFGMSIEAAISKVFAASAMRRSASMKLPTSTR